MKSMRSAINKVTVAILSLITLAASRESSAGRAVVCFSIDPGSAVSFDGTLTAQGQTSITSAVSYEYFRAKALADKNPLFLKISNQSDQEAIKTLRGALAATPTFFEKIQGYA